MEYNNKENSPEKEINEAEAIKKLNQDGEEKLREEHPLFYSRLKEALEKVEKTDKEMKIKKNKLEEMKKLIDEKKRPVYCREEIEVRIVTAELVGEKVSSNINEMKEILNSGNRREWKTVMDFKVEDPDRINYENSRNDESAQENEKYEEAMKDIAAFYPIITINDKGVVEREPLSLEQIRERVFSKKKTEQGGMKTAASDLLEQSLEAKGESSLFGNSAIKSGEKGLIKTNKEFKLPVEDSEVEQNFLKGKNENKQPKGGSVKTASLTRQSDRGLK